MSSAQSTYFVDDDGSPTGVGTLSDPFNSVQIAIDTASSGDVVLVQPGVYGRVDFKGRNLRLQSLQGPGLTTVGSVIFRSGESRSTLLRGFNIVRSQFEATALDCVGASPVIEHNWIVNQTISSGAGAAMRLLSNSSPLVQFNELCRNRSYPGSSPPGGGPSGSGAAIYISSSSPDLVGNRFERNSAFEDYGSSSGGAIFISNSTVLMKDNLFAANSCSDKAFNKGGAVYAQNSTLTLRGNTFVGNLCFTGSPPFGGPSEGGALYLLACVTTSSNNSFWGNFADEGHEIYERSGALLVAHTNIEIENGGLSGGLTVVMDAGVISQNPLLDASYHLGPDSPLIDVGNPQTPQGGLDFDRDPRVLDGSLSGVPRVDMGWDEWNPAMLSVLGDGALGSSLDCTIEGLEGQSYLLAGSLGTGDQPVRSYGSILLGLPGLFVIGTGDVTGVESAVIPLSTNLIGQTVHLQALVRSPRGGVGSFTRRVDVLLH